MFKIEILQLDGKTWLADKYQPEAGFARRSIAQRCIEEKGSFARRGSKCFRVVPA